MITREHQVKACAQFFGETNYVPLIHFTLQFNNCSRGLNAIEVNYRKALVATNFSTKSSFDKWNNNTINVSCCCKVPERVNLKDIAELDTGFSRKNFKFFIRPD